MPDHPETTDRCPVCKADLTGEPIPEEHRESYGGKTHYSRRIGLVWHDYVQEWHCPDCHAAWSRWTGEIISTASEVIHD